MPLPSEQSFLPWEDLLQVKYFKLYDCVSIIASEKGRWERKEEERREHTHICIHIHTHTYIPYTHTYTHTRMHMHNHTCLQTHTSMLIHKPQHSQSFCKVWEPDRFLIVYNTPFYSQKSSSAILIFMKFTKSQQRCIKMEAFILLNSQTISTVMLA